MTTDRRDLKVSQPKTCYFVLEGLNSFASSFYFYYLFFFMQRQFGFGNLGNLSLAALNGLVYAAVAWSAGRYGQRVGYFRALRLGFAILAAALATAVFVRSLSGQVAVMIAWTIGLCFTWPMLEALTSEHENAVGLQRMVGIYNLVWAGCSALAYFTGGALLQTCGIRSLFWIPASIHIAQLVLLTRFERRASLVHPKIEPRALAGPIELNPRPIARANLFLKMAWLANPFAYVAINTVAAVVPTLARKLELTPMLAGFFCSVWFFSRVGTFLVLWLWTGWRYRLRWFLSAYVLLILSFGAVLLVPHLLVVILAQIGFGFAVGLLYYSSLYYSMALGDTHGAHGGVHESAIGAGIFVGPAVGATALRVLPQFPNSGAWAVSVTLCGGLIGLLILALRRR